MASRTPEERVAFRLKNLEKWAGRINLQLTQAQRDTLRDSLSRQISLRKQYYALSDDLELAVVQHGAQSGSR